MSPRLPPTCAVLLLALAAGCSSWTRAGQYDGWALWVRDEESVDVGRYEAVFQIAFETVERHLGAFEQPVRIHAWDGGVELVSGNRGEIRERGHEGLVQDVPGIGPARVRAFHTRGGRGGVFIGEADESTAIHELVHARLAEAGRDLPLWFEEGLASLYADGAVHGGRWVVDGLACWPLRELAEEPLPDAELARLVALRARDEHSVRENLLVHFVGWALAFDLRREHPDAPWTA